MTQKQKIKVKKISSSIGRPNKQRQTVLGLGLKKINEVKELEDTPSVRGMVNKVGHLVKIID